MISEKLNQILSKIFSAIAFETPGGIALAICIALSVLDPNGIYQLGKSCNPNASAIEISPFYSYSRGLS